MQQPVIKINYPGVIHVVNGWELYCTTKCQLE